MGVLSLLWTDAATVFPWQEVSRSRADASVGRITRSGASLPIPSVSPVTSDRGRPRKRDLWYFCVRHGEDCAVKRKLALASRRWSLWQAPFGAVRIRTP